MSQVVLSREEYESLIKALREAIEVAREAIRQRDELLRMLKRERGGKRAG
ncbi:MAG: hypothetical protein QXE66_02695 [Desulfurococcaceae archaeon]